MAELEPHPAYLLTPRTDVLAWNRAATRLLGDPSRAPDGQRNVLWWLWAEGRYGSQGEQRRQTARSSLARFRAAYARRPDDPDFAALVAALHEDSAEFRAAWAEHDVQEDQLGTKHIDHPVLGPIVLHHLQSRPTSHPDLQLTTLVPADARTRRAFATD